VTFLGVTLESLVFCRNAFARGEPAAAIAAVLATASRLFLEIWHADLFEVMGHPRPRQNADSGAV
jgi:hypothetical protein